MRWLARYFARAVVRRIAVVLVVLAFSALSQCAHAQQAIAQDEGEAYMLCLGLNPDATCTKDPVIASGMYWFQCTYPWGGGSGPPNTGCGSTAYPAGKDCSTRPGNLADSKDFHSADYMTCVGSCQVGGNWGSATVGGVSVVTMNSRYYTGEVCKRGKSTNDPVGEKAEAAKETAPECVALGNGQTGCVKAGGDYCATASTGKTFCWSPTETGKKTDGADAQVKSPKGEPVTPPNVTVENPDWQRKEGHQQTSCVGATCVTYNVTNYSSVPAGTSKNGSGDNASDGSGNSSGNGKPGAGKDDDGKEDSATDSGNCDTPPVCVGDTLKCLQLKFTWKIDCNTQGAEVTKGDGCGEADVPVCAGKSCKAEAYSQVLQQWKQRCAVQAMGEGMATRAAGISNGDDAGVVEGIWGGQAGGSGLTLRQDLINVGGGGNARLLPDVEIEGHAWTVPQGFYDAIAAVKLVIIAMCTVIAMFVVGRNI
ncbi:A coat protein [Xanthomonas nasturtii]|uniref:A coat protein n=1 Tax=Xanthomonas nasturtii TaxID=1843581 RepID=A0ABT0LQT1_9XANT|nr:A coat protein [Xanthomonas nasturtii]MCL1551651.1 A coat protein [Xanthomonas nasturtii]MCL1555997.1 A coat protein [Xanthomonas nasturtii]